MPSEHEPTNDAPVVEVQNLERRFRRTAALDGVSLRIPRGVVYGLVGENGAGKTTLLSHLLGTLRAQRGSVRVFGLDPVADQVAVLSRLGYLSEDRDMPGWMRVRELMRYTQAFYPAWDEAYAETLREQFALDPNAKLKSMSRGERAKAGLLVALAYRPELLVLDEPSSGLDPLARREILGAIIRTVADEGRTVIFSSHLLDEVERMADHVAMIHGGKIVLDGNLDELRAQHWQAALQCDAPADTVARLPGVLHADRIDTLWSVTGAGDWQAFEAAARQAGATITRGHAPNLESIFLARAGQRIPREDAA